MEIVGPKNEPDKAQRGQSLNQQDGKVKMKEIPRVWKRGRVYSRGGPKWTSPGIGMDPKVALNGQALEIFKIADV